MLPVAILCGGLATRLGPITKSVPKALISIHGEPFLEHQLRLLQSSGIEQVVLCVGHFGEMIRDYVGDRFKSRLRISYSFDGPKLLGTAGAIRRALNHLGERFLVLYGDSYLPCDYGRVAASFADSGKRGLMTVYRNEGRFDASNIEFIDGRIVNYDKRTKTAEMLYIDYGLGAFHSSVFADLDPDEVCDLASIYRQLLEAGDLAGYEIRERFYEIGSPQGIKDLETYFSIHQS